MEELPTILMRLLLSTRPIYSPPSSRAIGWKRLVVVVVVLPFEEEPSSASSSLDTSTTSVACSTTRQYTTIFQTQPTVLSSRRSRNVSMRTIRGCQSFTPYQQKQQPPIKVGPSPRIEGRQYSSTRTTTTPQTTSTLGTTNDDIDSEESVTFLPERPLMLTC